ncbi:MerR family transcriptional regulator [Enterococcus sp. LJL51]|uniref:MerR family transcriptional regulator n=1 Tax=Enterococcus sp. LJL51 TaxID=3416656 RepID=UPI003CF6853C
MKEKYTTGEFSTLCRVSKKTLFHYEKIGLLAPAFVDVNGYRFYGLYQCDTVSTIKLFQELGLSLKEIREMLQSEDMEQKAQLLKEQQLVIENKLSELKAMNKQLRFMTDRFNHFRTIGTDQLFEEPLEREEYYFVEDKSGQPVSVNYLNYGYQYGVLFEEKELKQKMAVPKHSFIFQKVSKKKSNHIKQAGSYVSILHVLSNEEIMNCVPEFLNRTADYQMIGPLYHEDYCSELAGYSDKFVIKLSRRLS